jgi:hypothetical protein
VKLTASLGSEGEGAHFLPPLHLFCRTVVEVLNGSIFFFMISYNKMLLYLLDFIWAKTIGGTQRSPTIFKICILVIVCKTPNPIVCSLCCSACVESRKPLRFPDQLEMVQPTTTTRPYLLHCCILSYNNSLHQENYIILYNFISFLALFGIFLKSKVLKSS